MKDVSAVIRPFLLVEFASFALASLVHSGRLIEGYQHHAATIAETVIAAVLLLGLVIIWIRPWWSRAAGLMVQGFAFLGTSVGVFTIIVGVGPRTIPDILYHLAILVILAWGLRSTARSPAVS